MSTIEQEAREAPHRLKPCLHGGYHRPGQCPEANAAIHIGLDVDTFTSADVCDVELIGQTTEEITVIIGGYELRLRSTDLVAAVAGLDDLKHAVTMAVLDARQEQAEAERHNCDCGTRLEADEITCGAPACNRRLRDEQYQ